MLNYRLLVFTVGCYVVLELASFGVIKNLLHLEEPENAGCLYNCEPKRVATKRTTIQNVKVAVSNQSNLFMAPSLEYVPMTTSIINSQQTECSKMTEGDRKIHQKFLRQSRVVDRAQKCSKYQMKLARLIYKDDTEAKYQKFRDILHRNFSSLESNPAIAFAIVTHDQIGLFELLLHSIFRPENAYCIYVGANTPMEYKNAMEDLVHCYNQMYPNTSVFMAQNTTGVSWGNYSLIEADLICMEQLLQLKNHPWKYFINLAGTELPLYSIDELGHRLKLLKKPIATDSYHWKKYDKRQDHSYYRSCKKDGKQCTLAYKNGKGRPPYNLKIFKGYKNVMMRRDFAEFIINHPVAKSFRDYLKDTWIPDEHLYATLSRIKDIKVINPNAKNETFKVTQSRPNDEEFHVQKGYCQRISIWDHANFYRRVRAPYRCRGTYKRHICHLSMEDMAELYKRNSFRNGKQNCFIANKFDVTVDANTIICAVRKIHLQEYLSRSKIK